MAAEIAQLSVKISADTKDAEAGLDKTSEKVKETGGGFGEALKRVAEFTGAGLLVDGVSTAVGFLKDNLTEMVSSGMDANRMDALLAQGLRSTHDASGMTSDSLDALSTKLMNLTGIDDDSVKGAEQMLLTFTNIGKDVFPLATQAAADLATRMNNGVLPNAQQLSQVSIQLGKALNDPVKGITALQRVGVTFTDQQKEQIKQMMKAGDVAGAQKVILGELNKEFGGSAEAAGQANGGIAVLAAQFDNFKQTIGQAIIPILVQLMQAITPITGALAADLPGAIKAVQGVFNQWSPVIQTVWSYLKDFGTVLMQDIKPGLDAFTQGFQNLQGPGTSVQSVLKQVVSIGQSLYPVIDQVGKVFNQLGAWFLSTGVPAIQQFGSWFQKQLLPILVQVGGFILSTILPALGSLGDFIVTTVVPAVEQLVTWFGEHVMPILEQVVTVIVTDVLPTLESIAKTVLEKLVPALENLWNKISPILIPALQLLGTILKNVVGPAINLIITIIATIIDWIANFIGKIGDLLGWLGNLKDKIGAFVGDALGKAGELKDKFLGKIGELKDTVIKKVQDLATDFLGDKGLGGLPGKLLTFGENLVTNIINGIQNMAGNLADAAKKAIGGALNNIPGIGGILSHIPGFAGGGTMPYNGMAIVGESGPELVKLPAGAQVYSASESARMFSPAAQLAAGSAAGAAGAAGALVIPAGTPLIVQVPVNGRLFTQAILPDLVSAIRTGTGIRHM